MVEGHDRTELHKNCLRLEDHEEFYKNTEIIQSNPIVSACPTHVVFVEKEDAELKRGIQRDYSDRFPELLEMKEQYEFLEETTTAKRNNKNTMRNIKIIKVENYGNKEEDLWSHLKNIKDLCVEDGEISLHQIKRIPTDMLRKLAEVE